MSNAYLEFFKNLPASFTAQANYQVAILFTTVKNEASTVNEYKKNLKLVQFFYISIFF